MKVDLSEDAFTVVCGLVQDEADVNGAGIYAPVGVWEELRNTFPRAAFEQGVEEGDIDYDAEAGT